MNAEHEERILEAGLEEVLGGHYPPDLTSAILQAWEARQVTAPGALTDAGGQALLHSPPPLASCEPLAPPVQETHEPEPPPVYCQRTVKAVTARREARKSRWSWGSLVAAASLLAMVAGAGLYAVWLFGVGSGRQPLADSQTGRSGASESFPPRNNVAEERPDVPRGVPSDPAGRDAGAAPAEAIAAVASGASRPVNPPRTTDAEPAAPPVAKRPVRTPSSDPELIAFVNDAVRRAWRQHSVTPSLPASDDQWCQRVYQRLLGRAPAEDELKSFLASKAENKRKSLVDQLLAGDEYAGHWAERWATALVGPRQDHKPQDYCDRDGLVEYLRRAFRDDKPYDRMVYELLAACGSTRPGADDYNGAVNFLVSGANQQGLEATDRTSRFFLGKQLVCTRCHDHPATGWEQGEFWELNAFLRQMKVRAEAGSDVAVLTDQDFYGESGAATDAEIFYPLPNGRLGMAYPKLNGREIARSGLVDDVNRRQELAKLVIAADEFPRAIVNRVWGWLMGYGFTQPIDDMGLHNPPSHPELLARLADELAAHDYNLKGLVRWIVLSEPFSLSGKRTPESWMDVPAVGGRPLFARWYEDHQPQDPSDIYHALVRAVHSRSTVVGSTAGTLARRLGTPSAGPVQIIEPQPDASGVGPSWLAPLASSRLPPEQKIQHVFLSVAGRAPTSREMTAAKLVLADRLSDSAALREIWLTLVAAERAAAANGS